MSALYRVRKPTLVLVLDEGKPRLLRVEAGTVLRVKDDSATDTNAEIECGRNGRKVRIFRVDLEERAERLASDIELEPLPTLP